MKKIYLTLLAGFFAGQSLNAQLILTRTAFDPAIGDINSSVPYDSTAAIPRSSGTNQTWNFSSLTQSTLTPYASTFVATSTSTDASMFPGATIAERYDDDGYTFYKSTAAQTEVMGFVFTGISMQYTNTIIQVKWPTAYGDSHTDSFSGTLNGSPFGSMAVAGTMTSTATGSGNLILPGGTSYSNILQLKTVQTTTTTMTLPTPTTLVNKDVNHIYFHSSSKFPLISVYYGEDGVASITVNKQVAVGLTDYNFDATFAIYPNPARDNFNVKLSNTSGETCFVDIYNSVGQLVKNHNLGNDRKIESALPIRDLAPGIYLVKTSLGQKSSARRLVVE